MLSLLPHLPLLVQRASVKIILLLLLVWLRYKKDAIISDFTKVWLHLVLVLFPLLTWLMLYLCDPVNLLLGDKTWQKLDDRRSHPVIAAIIQISALFTFFVFILDWIAFSRTISGDFLAYDRNAAFYLSAATGLLIDFGAFGWVVYVLISLCHWDFKHFWQYWKGHNPVKKECPEHIKNLMYTITVAPILCISNHLYYIILAFVLDPFHAGLIVIDYAVTFFLFYFIFRQVYSRVVLRSNRRLAPWEKDKMAVNIATSEIDLRYQLAQVAKEKPGQRDVNREWNGTKTSESETKKTHSSCTFQHSGGSFWSHSDWPCLGLLQVYVHHTLPLSSDLQIS